MASWLHAFFAPEPAGALAPIPAMPWWGYALLVVALVVAARFVLPRIRGGGR